MERGNVSALAEELAQLTCRHLPWTDQRVITLELGVGECDLAIDDMVRGAVHSACPVPGHIIARLHEWLDGIVKLLTWCGAARIGRLWRLRRGRRVESWRGNAHRR